MLTIESVPIPQVGGMVTIQVGATAGEDLMATVQASGGANTSLALLDAQGNVVVQSDGQSATIPADTIDTYIAPGEYCAED